MMTNFTNARGQGNTPEAAAEALPVTLISPYHGGSHAAWAAGLMSASRHHFNLLSLPARFWKWRMHGGAVTLARRFKETEWRPRIILATDMLDLSTFLALTRRETAGLPVIVYIHENQLTYPLSPDPEQGPMRRQAGERDLHYAFINLASMMAADRVVFNSHYHRHSFLSALPNFLRRFPEYTEPEVVDLVSAKSMVLPVGIDLAGLNAAAPARAAPEQGPGERPPLILWNQRWEYDKNPERFFRALYEVAAAGFPFRLAICGENFRQRPTEFDTALNRLGERIIHVGHAPTEHYRRLLWEADVTISTADHEFFGISILEAIACHTFPILPKALSYPELLPREFHGSCLYASDEELLSKIVWALRSPREAASISASLANSASRFNWPKVAADYDALIAGMALEGASNDR